MRAASIQTVPAARPAAAEIASRAFYPLTLPLTVGPGTISIAITIGAHHPQSMRSLLVNGTADAIGAALIAATVFVCYRYADRILRVLGETGTSVLIRLSAFILLCIGVQIFWTGASALLATVAAACRALNAQPGFADALSCRALRGKCRSRSLAPCLPTPVTESFPTRFNSPSHPCSC